MLEKCILIAWGKWSGSKFRGSEEKMEPMRERHTEGKSPSQICGCRLQSIINAMQIRSRADKRCNDGCQFPPHRRLPRGMMEWEKTTEWETEKSNDERWTGKKRVGANLLFGLFIPVGERQKEGHDYLSKCDGLILRGEEMKSCFFLFFVFLPSNYLFISLSGIHIEKILQLFSFSNRLIVNTCLLSSDMWAWVRIPDI